MYSNLLIYFILNLVDLAVLGTMLKKIVCFFFFDAASNFKKSIPL